MTGAAMILMFNGDEGGAGTGGRPGDGLIEHMRMHDVIKTADWIIDLGPEGGVNGGEIVAEGTPEQVAKEPKSFTGAYLAETLKKSPISSPAEAGVQPLKRTRRSRKAMADEPDLLAAK